MSFTHPLFLAATTAGQDYSDFVRQFLTVAIFAGLAVVMAGVMLGAARILRPDRPQGQKYIAYESGVDPVGEHWSQTQVRYYVFALMFVLFDIEAVFIFPWATRLNASTDLVDSGGEVFATLLPYGTFGLVKMLIFIGILALGLVYAWRKRVLRWM